VLEIISPVLDMYITKLNYVDVTFEATGGTPPYTFAASKDMVSWVSPILPDSHRFTQLEEGVHRLYIKVTDAYSQSYVDYVDVTVDQTPPPAPVANPAGGLFNAELDVELYDAEAGVKIYYTLDGTIPDTSSILYTGAISIG